MNYNFENICKSEKKGGISCDYTLKDCYNKNTTRKFV